MSCAMLEVFARQAVQEVAGDRLARREADAVDEAVELRPGRATGPANSLSICASSPTSQSKISLEPNSAANSVMRSLKRSPT